MPTKIRRTTEDGWTLVRPPHAVASLHGWEPGDDGYVPQSRPSAAIIKATATALREVEDLAVELGLPYRAITICFAVDLPDEIGKYINGTGSTGPAILLDGPKLMRASRELHVPLYDAVFSTLVHELGHAAIDAAGIELPYEEEEPIVEAFTQRFMREGAPDWAARDLMRAAEATADQ